MNRIAAQRKLGQNIKAMRKSRGLTQQAFAKMCSMSAGRMWRLEYGRVNMTLATIVRIAARLETRPSALLRGIQ